MRMTTLAVAMITAAGTAQAQDIYAGVAFDYNLPHAGDAQSVASLLAGATFDVGPVDIGIEADFGAAAALGGEYDTSRLRLIGGYDLGDFSALATVGATYFDVGSETHDGYHIGIGAQMPLNASLDLRGEIIRDFMEDSYGTNVTTSRIAAIYSF